MFEWGNSAFDLAKMLAKRVHGSEPLWSTWKGEGECALGARVKSRECSVLKWQELRPAEWSEGNGIRCGKGTGNCVVFGAELLEGEAKGSFVDEIHCGPFSSHLGPSRNPSEPLARIRNSVRVPIKR